MPGQGLEVIRPALRLDDRMQCRQKLEERTLVSFVAIEKWAPNLPDL